MSLQTIDKPNLYFSAQLLINNILAKIADNSANSSSDNEQLQYHLFELKQIFNDNIASTTTHLEAITELTKNYFVSANNQDQDKPLQLVISFLINAANNTVILDLNSQAVALVKSKEFTIKAVD